MKHVHLTEVFSVRLAPSLSLLEQCFADAARLTHAPGNFNLTAIDAATSIAEMEGVAASSIVGEEEDHDTEASLTAGILHIVTWTI